MEAPFARKPRRRLVHTRPRRIRPAPSSDQSKPVAWPEEFNDPLPPWKGNDGSSEGNHYIANIAANLHSRYYRFTKGSIWPQGFASVGRSVSVEDKRQFGRVRFAVNDAITVQLIHTLGHLELKVMLMIYNRTLKWNKLLEGIPHEHFHKGVFVEGKPIHAPISRNRTHLNEAIERLRARKFIKVDEAPSQNGTVRIFAIDITGLLRGADAALRMATRQVKLPRRGTRRS